MRTKVFAFSVFVFLLAGCADKNSISIKGNLKNKNLERIYLDKIDVDRNTRIDSARVRNSGNFKFKFKGTGPDFYRIGSSVTDFMTILAEPGEKITLSFKGDNLIENYDVSGSAGSEKIKMLDLSLAGTLRKIDSLKTIYNKESTSPDFGKIEPLLNEEYLKLLKGQRKYNIEFIIKNLSSFASIKALYQRIDAETYVLYEPRDLQFFKLVSDTLISHYPNSNQARALKKNFEREMNQMFMNQIEKVAKNAPETKLDPNLISLNGKRISLSSLKGKVVLLTFWTSTSSESVSENLSLKDLYKTYKPKGFEIYQINLDVNETYWRNAVKFDELPWINVREDDPMNPITARIYNVKSLPTNYLYDKSGTIIGSNLHGKALQIKLGQLLGN